MKAKKPLTIDQHPERGCPSRSRSEVEGTWRIDEALKVGLRLRQPRSVSG